MKSVSISPYLIVMFSALIATQSPSALGKSTLPDGCTVIAPQLHSPIENNLPVPPFPVQLEVRTPFEPTEFASDDHKFLIYELHLHNFANDALTLHGIEIMNADGASEVPLAEISGAQLNALIRPYGAEKGAAQTHLSGGQSAIAFLCLAFDRSATVPNKLRNRIRLDQFFAEGPVIETHHTKLLVLGSPLSGAGWVSVSGPSLESHHRTGVFVAGGVARISRRYAIDWKIIKQESSFSGDPLDVHSYFAYGKDVLSVADATVVEAVDGLPDNVPRIYVNKVATGFHTALPDTIVNTGGNHVVLDLGDGQVAYYAHLQPGSVKVKVGEHVRRGQLLARVGSSGDAREPHLHFQVTTVPDKFSSVMGSEGVPYQIDSYRVQLANGEWETRKNDYPMGELVVDFSAAGSDSGK